MKKTQRFYSRRKTAKYSRYLKYREYFLEELAIEEKTSPWIRENGFDMLCNYTNKALKQAERMAILLEELTEDASPPKNVLRSYLRTRKNILSKKNEPEYLNSNYSFRAYDYRNSAQKLSANCRAIEKDIVNYLDDEWFQNYYAYNSELSSKEFDVFPSVMHAKFYLYND